jgi:hypothetical protein
MAEYALVLSEDLSPEPITSYKPPPTVTEVRIPEAYE